MTIPSQQLAAALASGLTIAPLLMAPATGFGAIEEIVVTSRKQEEHLQDIPLAVAAFDAEKIENQGLSTTADIVKLVPGVQFDQAFSAADTRISIRGINSTRGRASVALLVDGVDVSGENVTSGGGGSLLNSRLVDLERVELVKGPQSALYGRNAFAGAINYITRKPSMDGFRASAYADVRANYAGYDVRASVSGPLVKDTLAVSVNAGTYDAEGFYRNHNQTDPVANEGTLGGSKNNGARLVALWTPNDAWTVTGSASYTENRAEPRAVAKVGEANTFYWKGAVVPAGTPVGYTGSTSDDPAQAAAQNAINFPYYTGTTTPSVGVVDYGQWLGTVGHVDEGKVNLSRSQRNNAPFKGSEDDTLLSFVKADWKLDAVELKSLTSYLHTESYLHEDVDFQDGRGTPILGRATGIPATFSLDNDYLDTTNTSYYAQEFTLESRSWDRGRWLIGVSGFWERTHNLDYSLGWYNNPAVGDAYPGQSNAGQYLAVACSYRDSALIGSPPKAIDRETDSYSLFALLGYDITDKLKATVEARYMMDTITVSTNTNIDRVSQYVLSIPICQGLTSCSELPVSGTQRSSTINPRLALDYHFTDEVMAYASAAKGTKPAGYGTAQFATPNEGTAVKQEELYAFELGTKTQWFDRTVQANAALFYNDYKNRVVGITVSDPNSGWASAGNTNAGSAETKGIELDFVWKPIDPLTLGLAYAYTDAKWTDFNYTKIRARSLDNAGNPRKPSRKDQAICGNTAGDCTGALISGIPKHALTAQANYTAPIKEDLEGFVNLVGQFEDKRALQDRINAPFVDAYFIMDLQLGLQTQTWTAQVYVDNLLDDHTVRWAQLYGDFRDGMYGGGSGGEPRDETVFAFLPPPRVVGVRATWKFGEK